MADAKTALLAAEEKLKRGEGVLEADAGYLEAYVQDLFGTLYCRRGLLPKGLELYGDPDERANVVTAVELPDDVDGGKVPKILRDSYGITANGGQGRLKGKIIRIAHTGYFGAFDIVVSLAGLEMTLARLGHQVELGAGPGAAQQVFLEAGVAATPA